MESNECRLLGGRALYEGFNYHTHNIQINNTLFPPFHSIWYDMNASPFKQQFSFAQYRRILKRGFRVHLRTIVWKEYGLIVSS